MWEVRWPGICASPRPWVPDQVRNDGEVEGLSRRESRRGHRMVDDQMLSMAAWKSPGSLHWRGSSSGGPRKIFTGLFLGGSLASDNLWALDWPESGFSKNWSGSDSSGSGSLEDLSASVERWRRRSRY